MFLVFFTCSFSLPISNPALTFGGKFETIIVRVYLLLKYPPSERKAASKRVDDAAENLLYTLFSALERGRFDDIVDERKLYYQFGQKAVDITKFRHFLIRHQTLISIHEATRLTAISNGYPSLFFVVRTPYHAAYTLLAQLYGRPPESDSNNAAGDDKENGHFQNGVKPLTGTAKAAKFFQIPAEFERPLCKLDAVIPPLQPNPDTDRVIAELTEIRSRMSQGESCLRAADDRNIWLREPLFTELSKPAEPKKAATDCNAGRVLLYDLGLISEENYKAGDILLLDSSSVDEFYRDMHRMVDRSPTKLLQSVRLFYVRDGQRTAVDILNNVMNLQTTSSQFCGLLAELGEGVEVATHPYWTGDWRTAFSAERIAFTTPTERIRKHPSLSCDCDPALGALSDEQNEPDRTLNRDFGTVIYLDVSSSSGGRALSLSSSEDRSAGRASGSSGQSNKVMSEILPAPHAKSHSGLDSGSETKAAYNMNCCFPGSGQNFVKRSSDQRVFVVWLERTEDMHYFPCEEMFAVTTDSSMCGAKNSARPDLVVIFLSQVESELVQVNIVGDWTKYEVFEIALLFCSYAFGSVLALHRQPRRFALRTVHRDKTIAYISLE
ncbi:unnamed protein product [Gongylonema pulchrum]|uniref:Ubiquitinyl hydrolase 1 n=1 Tax=Gongylonema pulchrum TaxID=637853 RepID=A0A183E054_9BILA|nr:unnamed protein product [Gongylonema pulchrum]